MTKKDAQFWLLYRDRQRKWVDDHGRNRAGYVARYGGYGNGGSAIYDADKAELDNAEKKGLEAQKLLGLLL